MDKIEISSAENGIATEDLMLSIKKTKSSLSKKINKLEDEIADTFHQAKNDVKDQVEDVKKIFDLNYQIGNYPWKFFGGAVLAGVFLSRGLMAYDRSSEKSSTNNEKNNEEPSVFHKLGEAAKEEVSQVKNKALNSSLNILKEVVKSMMPSLFSKSVDNVFKKASE